ncbi:hypothetical protein WJX73_006719, partial [Symbiochloris irregularis]
ATPDDKRAAPASCEARQDTFASHSPTLGAQQQQQLQHFHRLQRCIRGWYCNRNGQSAYLNGPTQVYPHGPFQQPPEPAYANDSIYRSKSGNRCMDCYGCMAIRETSY